MAKVKMFKNTFCSSEQEYLHVGEIILELKYGRCKYEDLPDEVRQEVDLEYAEAEETIKNTFAPNCNEEYLSINGIIGGIRVGQIDGSKLPQDIRKKVDAALERDYGTKIKRLNKIEA